jgi:adenylate kinase
MGTPQEATYGDNDSTEEKKMPLTARSLVRRSLLRGKGNSSVKLFAIFFLAFFSSAFVGALHDGIRPRLFGFKRRSAFTQHDTHRPFGLESVAVDNIPDGGSSKLQPIVTTDLANSHRTTDGAFSQALRDIKHSPESLSRPHEPPRIIIIGGPASGKGTQCEYIAAQYGVVHLSTGDMLREAVRSGSKVGKIAKDFMNRGELVPDETMINIVNERLDQEDCKQRGWLLDGFPRTKVQAAHLHDLGIVPDLIVFLDVPDEILIERVTGRRLDPQTGKIYHLSFQPPPAEIVGRLEQRSDDTAEKAVRRLEHFHSNLSEIRSYLGDAIVQVNGTRAPGVISNDMARIIDRKTKKRRVVKA